MSAVKTKEIKSWSTASALLSMYAPWLQTHRQNPSTGNDSYNISLLHSQSRAPTIDCCMPEIWPWPMTLTFGLWPWTWTLTLTLKQGNGDVKTWFFPFDFDLWPIILIYNSSIAYLKVDLHTKSQGCRSNCSNRRVHANIHTDRRTDTTRCIISLLR